MAPPVKRPVEESEPASRIREGAISRASQTGVRRLKRCAGYQEFNQAGWELAWCPTAIRRTIRASTGCVLWAGGAGVERGRIGPRGIGHSPGMTRKGDGAGGASFRLSLPVTLRRDSLEVLRSPGGPPRRNELAVY